MEVERGRVGIKQSEPIRSGATFLSGTLMTFRLSKFKDFSSKTLKIGGRALQPGQTFTILTKLVYI